MRLNSKQQSFLLIGLILILTLLVLPPHFAPEFEVRPSGFRFTFDPETFRILEFRYWYVSFFFVQRNEIDYDTLLFLTAVVGLVTVWLMFLVRGDRMYSIGSIWTRNNKKFKLNRGEVNPFDFPFHLRRRQNFFISSFFCPNCDLLMYKTIFRPAYQLKTIAGMMDIQAVYTCAGCRSFFAPEPDSKLGDKQGFMKPRIGFFRYRGMLKRMNRAGTMTGEVGI